MAISIAKGLNPDETPVILCNNTQINDVYSKSGIRFEKLNYSNIRKYHKEGAVFISHHRKSTTFALLISRILIRNKIRLIHVAHNSFSTLKHLTLFPKYNVAVSNAVKENMKSYFGISEDRTKVIYNGIVDKFDSSKVGVSADSDCFNILFIGRIDPVKNQVRFVKEVKGKLNSNIRIYFGGVGVDSDALREEIGNDSHFVMLGLINIYSELYKYDYVCLFSQKEGLPLSLIEAEMFHKPLITNDIPQSLEVNTDGRTGYVNHNWEEIVECLNNLPSRDSADYRRLSENSRSEYERLFNYDVMIEQYKRYIEDKFISNKK